jgi:4-hydroxybenzoate polyprenyltransferase/phosphoserine phosphatase
LDLPNISVSPPRSGFDFQDADGAIIEITAPVLCVDLDGTFTPTDTLYECFAVVLWHRPWLLLWVPFWLLNGREHLKQKLATLVQDRLRIDLFPRRAEVVRLIETARAHGRVVELVSATHQDLLAILNTDGLFDAVRGSGTGTNLKGETKAALLKSLHPDGFAYVGDSAADLPVWRAAETALGAGLSSSTRRKAAGAGLQVREITRRGSAIKPLLKAMRMHQWAKNVLVFVSLGLSLHNINATVVLRFVETFCAFCMLTSGTYIFNDLVDLAADRQHKRKRLRPLASGALPIAIGAPVAILLVLAGLLSAFLAEPYIALVLAGYLVLTMAYSFGLKRMALVDVLTISSLFTARIVAGAFGYAAPLSPWLLIFSLFFFTSLALMKRAAEVVHAPPGKKIAGRGYHTEDGPFLFSMGTACSVGALIVFALYISDASTLMLQYKTPAILWAALGVLGFWTMRMWLKTTRGEMDDDPILFAVRDRPSLLLGAITLAVSVLAQLV